MPNARILGNEIHNWKVPYALPEVALGKTIRVTDPTSLQAAVKTAAGGELILLVPGDYGSIRFKDKQFQQPVTIAAARNPIGMNPILRGLLQRDTR